MDKYTVKMSPRAVKDVDGIFHYIISELLNEQAAFELTALLEETVLSLDTMPYRGTERRIGAYANKGYRQLFVKNFTVVYRIDEKRKMVVVVTIRYTPSDF